MILAICSTLEDQGLYALASNYGGLVARIVLQPIEESSRLFFGRTLPVANGQVKRKEETGNAQAYLVNILRLYSVLTVLVWAAGPLLLPVAFNIVLSSRWASLNVQETLLSYCYYIPFLAFNGITEAFVSSAASNSELRTQASWMWACSVAFAFFAYFALKVAHLGVRGLVWVNIVNMTLRTAWSLRFIRIYFRRLHQELKLRDILPKQETCVVGFCAWGSLFILHTAAVNTIDLVKLLCTGTTVVFTMYVKSFATSSLLSLIGVAQFILRKRSPQGANCQIPCERQICQPFFLVKNLWQRTSLIFKPYFGSNLRCIHVAEKSSVRIMRFLFHCSTEF